jgi:hypothetical protein
VGEEETRRFCEEDNTWDEEGHVGSVRRATHGMRGSANLGFVMVDNTWGDKKTPGAWGGRARFFSFSQQSRCGCGNGPWMGRGGCRHLSQRFPQITNFLREYKH